MYVYVLAHCTLRTNSLDVSSYITRLMYNIGVRTTQQRELKDNHHHLPRAPSRPGAGNAIPCLPSRKHPSFLWSRLHGSDERAHKTNWETRGHVHQPSILAAYFLCAGSTRTIISCKGPSPISTTTGEGETTTIQPRGAPLHQTQHVRRASSARASTATRKRTPHVSTRATKTSTSRSSSRSTKQVAPARRAGLHDDST